MIYQETVDLNLLKQLINCNLLTREERRMLKKYKLLKDESDKFTVSYEQKLENIGRFFALH